MSAEVAEVAEVARLQGCKVARGPEPPPIGSAHPPGDARGKHGGPGKCIRLKLSRDYVRNAQRQPGQHRVVSVLWTADSACSLYSSTPTAPTDASLHLLTTLSLESDTERLSAIPRTLSHARFRPSPAVPRVGMDAMKSETQTRRLFGGPTGPRETPARGWDEHVFPSGSPRQERSSVRNSHPRSAQDRSSPSLNRKLGATRAPSAVGTGHDSLLEAAS